jgi:hypothetical protein
VDTSTNTLWFNSCLSSKQLTVINTRSTPNFSSRMSNTIHIESRWGCTRSLSILIWPTWWLRYKSIPRRTICWWTSHQKTTRLTSITYTFLVSTMNSQLLWVTSISRKCHGFSFHPNTLITTSNSNIYSSISNSK